MPDLYDRNQHRGPNIRIPPAFFVAGFLVALLLDATVVSIPLAEGSRAARTLDVAGWALVGLGLAVSFAGIATFRVAGTTMFPFEPASRLVRRGPYRFTRNPMYLGNTISYIGFALTVNTVWPLLLLPVVLWGLWKLVVAEEERYLESTFGEDYLAYKRQVRRWL